LGQNSATTMSNALAFDVGGTKTAWALIDEEGRFGTHAEFPTPQNRDEFLVAIRAIVAQHPEAATIGVGIAGTVHLDHKHTLVCPHIPGLSHFDLAGAIKTELNRPIVIDNDGRCALLGEAWVGAATEASSAVMITLGTGVGGAVMQRTRVLPHPKDLSKEISHLMVDPNDLYPAKAGRGTVEALIGGKNVEERFGVSLKEMAAGVEKNDADAIAFWQELQPAFLKCIQAIRGVYGCNMIIVGGIGSKDLAYYLGDNTPPCPVIPAQFGPMAGLFGAAKLAWDASFDDAKDWDE
jgi:glucokinase